MPCTRVSSNRQVAPIRSGGTYAPASSTSTSLRLGLGRGDDRGGGTRRKIGPSLDNSPCRLSLGRRREGGSGHLAQMVGHRGGGSEHAPHLIDAEGVETELTHDDTVISGSAHILVRMNPRIRRLIVSGVLGGLVLIVFARRRVEAVR